MPLTQKLIINLISGNLTKFLIKKKHPPALLNLPEYVTRPYTNNETSFEKK